jgi:peptide/nickel transport system substrate-binding protein
MGACPRQEAIVETLDRIDYYPAVHGKGRIARMGLVRTIGVATVLVVATLLSPVNAAELKVGLAAPPSSIDPHFHNLSPNNALLSHIFDRLVHQDANQSLIPGLAESWKALNDTTWEFKLRKGVKFHDGSPFTADDVLCSFKRAPNVPNSPSSFGAALRAKTAEKVDEYTIVVKTGEPQPLLPNDLSSIAIVSKSAGCDAKTEDFNSGKAAVGTGPFKFVEYVPGDRIVMAVNEAYWGGKSIWDKVTFRPITSGPARVAAVLAGDVDLIEDVPTADIAKLSKDDRVSISQTVSNRVIYFHLDHFREISPFITAKDGSAIKNPLRDQRVRLAISKAINRDAIVERVMEGSAIAAGQLLADKFFGTSKSLKPEKYDVEGAKKLLKEAGYEGGFKMKIHGPSGRYVNDAKIIEVAAQMLTRIGIETSVETMPPAVFFRRASSGGPDNVPEFSFILVGWGSDTGETSSPLRTLLYTVDPAKGTGAANRGRYSNRELDKLVDAALATVDDEKRGGLLGKASEVAIGDLGIIPLHYQLSVWATRKGLKIVPRANEYTLVTGVTRQ